MDSIEERIAKLETELVELKKKTLDMKDLLEIMRLVAETRKYAPPPFIPQPTYPIPWWEVPHPYPQPYVIGRPYTTTGETNIRI